MLQLLRQKYLLESVLLVVMMSIAIYARTRLPEQTALPHALHSMLR